MLQYEHAIRKHAYKVMATAGYTFGAVLVHAYKEPSVKERNFATPLALHAKRPQPWNATERPTKRKNGKGRGKGKDGKGAKKLKEGSDRTPDGQPICFRYNGKGGCKQGAKCHYVHVCCASASTPLRSARRRRPPLRPTQPTPPALRTDRAKPRWCRRYSLLIYHNQLLRALRGPRRRLLPLRGAR